MNDDGRLRSAECAFQRIAGIPLDDPVLRADLLDTTMLRPLGVLTASMGFLMMSAAAAWFTRSGWAAAWLSLDLLLLTARAVPALQAWRERRRVSERVACWILMAASVMFATFGIGCAASFLTGIDELRIAAMLATMGLLTGLVTRWAALPRLAVGMIAIVSTPVALAMGSLGVFVAILFVVLALGAAVQTIQNHRSLLALLAAERAARRCAEVDGLTGLLNRGGLDVALERLSGAAVALLFLDLDGFKAINDGHGHAAGDEVLATIAARLRTVAGERPVARLGGDEFVIVLPGGDAVSAADVALAARDHVARPIGLNERGAIVSVGTSIGMAAADAGWSAAALLAEADAALYAAKRARYADARRAVWSRFAAA